VRKKNYRPRRCYSKKGPPELEGQHDFIHKPVLLKESLDFLNIKKDGNYVDATFGLGGHSREILSMLGESGRLLVIDKDISAISEALKLQSVDNRLFVEQGSFGMIKKFSKKYFGDHNIDGLIADLGVSSPQLDNSERGFSFMKDGPLDMRMDRTQEFDAQILVNEFKEDDIATMLKEYGEERFAKRIARAICDYRKEKRIVGTFELSEIIKKAIPKWEKEKHPATRSFQAIRIFVNNELEDLKNMLKDGADSLNINGRFVVISFHSLEDKIVKNFFNAITESNIPAHIPVRDDEISIMFKKIGRMVRASRDEIVDNKRARSAIMRSIERIKL